jgi:hypothetical protein
MMGNDGGTRVVLGKPRGPLGHRFGRHLKLLTQRWGAQQSTTGLEELPDDEEELRVQ